MLGRDVDGPDTRHQQLREDPLAQRGCTRTCRCHDSVRLAERHQMVRLDQATDGHVWIHAGRHRMHRARLEVPVPIREDCHVKRR